MKKVKKWPVRWLLDEETERGIIERNEKAIMEMVDKNLLSVIDQASQ